MGTMPFDQRAFRNALSHFPTGVAVVTAPAEGQDPIAITVSSFNSVSLDPPLILFSIHRHLYSLETLLQAERFGVSVLRQEQHHLSSRFAGRQGAKWADVAPVQGETGCPLIGSCLASFECAPFAVHEGGDHLIIVGRVLRFATAEEGVPLVFFRGAYHAIANHAACGLSRGND
jgi:flavin reductase (DIM6/NTAB) family NADH-FMN oxidoreductase RutF